MGINTRDPNNREDTDHGDDTRDPKDIEMTQTMGIDTRDPKDREDTDHGD